MVIAVISAIAAPVIVTVIAAVAVTMSAAIVMTARGPTVSIAVATSMVPPLKAFFAYVRREFLGLAGGLIAFRSRTDEACRTERERNPARDYPNRLDHDYLPIAVASLTFRA